MPTRHEADTRLLLSISVLALDDAEADGSRARRPSVADRLRDRLGPELHARLVPSGRRGSRPDDGRA